MKKSVLLFITAFVSVPVIMFVFVSCIFLNGYIYDQKSATLQVEVSNLADYIESTFTTQYNRVAQNAQEPEFLAYIQDQGNPEKFRNAQMALFNTFSTTDNASEVSLITNDGTVLISSNLNSPENIVDTELFKDISQTQLPYVTTNFDGNLPLITIGFPIVNGGQLMGIYIRITPLNYVPIFSQNVNFDKENVYIITDQNETMIYRPNNEYTLVPTNQLEENNYSTELSQLYTKLDSSSSNKGQIQFSHGASKSVGSYRIIKTLNWICLVSESKASILYDLNYFQLIIFGAAIVYIIIIIITIYKYFGRYLNTATGYARNIEEFLNGNNDVECATMEKASIVYDLGNGINHLFNKIRATERDNSKLNTELSNLKLVDPITGLHNIKSIYELIKERYEKYANQALVMFDTGIFDEINDTFGEDVSNRLLEIVTHLLNELNLDHVHLSRLSKDKFVIFFEDFEDVEGINEKLNELKVRLKSTPRIDDLQVELRPNIVAVFRNDKFDSYDDWIDLVKDTFRKNKTPEGSFVILDFNVTDDLLNEEIDLFKNILETNDEATEGFSRSKKLKSDD